MPRTKRNSIELNIDFDFYQLESLSRPDFSNIYTRHRGSKSKFLDAGLPPGSFPGDPVQLKTVSRFVINGGSASLTRIQGKPDLFELVWYIPEHLRAIEDPGIDAAMAAVHASPARFEVGDACVWWCPGYEDHGEKLEITGGYCFRRINSTTGRFIDKEGYRFDYRWGYWARAIADKPHFYPAYELRDINHGIRHIRLVSAAD